MNNSFSDSDVWDGFIEEVIAGLYNLIEGFDLFLIVWILQFWLFNIFAFSPIILSYLFSITWDFFLRDNSSYELQYIE